MTVRSNSAYTTRMARMDKARATIREIDDNHLMQETKETDVYYGETHTGVEVWQQLGATAVAIKQQEEAGKKPSNKKSGNSTSEINHDQPKGPAAEAVMLYVNGSRSHAVALIDDRRVRPYGMKAGRGASYAPDGSEQMLYFKQDGTYVVSLDGKSVEEPKANKTRMVSLRHVNKPMQTHKIEEGQKQEEEYKHEGASVNMEVRVTKGRIEFRAGNTVVGYYDKDSSTWVFIGTVKLGVESASHNVYGNADGVGKTSDKVFVNAPLPGPPTSLDTAP